MTPKWRGDVEVARPLGLIQFGLLTVVAGILATIAPDGGWILSFLGVALIGAGAASVVRGVRLMRRHESGK